MAQSMICSSIADATDTYGEWTQEGDAYAFRTTKKALLKWWPSTGSVIVQGSPAAANLFRAGLIEQISDFDGSRMSRDDNMQVFIVHGHDRDALKQLKMVLYELNLKPYILQETSGDGKTIIEALEAQLDGKRPRVAFGIVLLTPDDLGASMAEGAAGLRPRARQNVILEMGMLISSLGRGKVLILVRGSKLERPSDSAGIIYKKFDNDVKEVAADICDRLRAAGFDLKAADITKACR